MRLPIVCVLFACTMPASSPSWALDCWRQAAERHGVPVELLYAIAQTESGLNPRAINRSHLSRTGSYDIGLMQINSSHLHALARRGIREQDLYDPCINLHVGAWLLADSIARRGLSWNAVGAYNAACSQLKGEACRLARARYAWRVYRRLTSRRDLNRAVAQPLLARPMPAPAPLQLAVRVSP